MNKDQMNEILYFTDSEFDAWCETASDTDIAVLMAYIAHERARAAADIAEYEALETAEIIEELDVEVEDVSVAASVLAKFTLKG